MIGVMIIIGAAAICFWLAGIAVTLDRIERIIYDIAKSMKKGGAE